MKQKKRLYLSALLGLLLMLSLNTIASAATIKLNKSKLELETGDSYQLKLTGTSKKVTWESASPHIATVSSNGKLKATSAGQTSVFAIDRKSTRLSSSPEIPSRMPSSA